MNDLTAGLIIALLNKILWAGFAFSVLGIARVIYLFVRALRRNPPEQLVLSKGEIIALGVYVAVIIMSIFTGIKL
jgi:hypothetical protein